MLIFFLLELIEKVLIFAQIIQIIIYLYKIKFSSTLLTPLSPFSYVH